MPAQTPPATALAPWKLLLLRLRLPAASRQAPACPPQLPHPRAQRPARRRRVVPTPHLLLGCRAGCCLRGWMAGCLHSEQVNRRAAAPLSIQGRRSRGQQAQHTTATRAVPNSPHPASCAAAHRPAQAHPHHRSSAWWAARPRQRPPAPLPPQQTPCWRWSGPRLARRRRWPAPLGTWPGAMRGM